MILSWQAAVGHMRVLCILLCVVVTACSKSEPFQSTHPNGRLAAQGQLVDSVPEGDWTEWYESGEVKLKTHFSKGAEHGVRTTFYENKTVAEEGAFRDGLQVGVWQMWFESGSPMARTTYVEGVENGLRTTWYDGGQPKSEAEIANGLQEGLRRFWYPSGKVLSQAWFHLDRRSGPEEEWAEDGTWKQTLCFEADVQTDRWDGDLGAAQPPFDRELCTGSGPGLRAAPAQPILDPTLSP